MQEDSNFHFPGPRVPFYRRSSLAYPYRKLNNGGYSFRHTATPSRIGRIVVKSLVEE